MTEETFSKEHRNERKERLEARQKGNRKAEKRMKRVEIKTGKKQQQNKKRELVMGEAVHVWGRGY